MDFSAQNQFHWSGCPNSELLQELLTPLQCGLRCIAAVHCCGAPCDMWTWNEVQNSSIYPLVMSKELLKMAIEIVSFPWKMVIFHSYVNVYLRVYTNSPHGSVAARIGGMDGRTSQGDLVIHLAAVNRCHRIKIQDFLTQRRWIHVYCLYIVLI